MRDLKGSIRDYWTDRAEGYSLVNKEELITEQKKKWTIEIENLINRNDKKNIKVLDIGCGPGFFSIILSTAGYKVTAIDYTKAMLEEAKINAEEEANNIEFIQMDAQNLSFEEESFDVVISRNLTWNLEEPEKAYKEWIRVLKKGGILINFDANWYHHLFNEEKKKQYELDRKEVINKNIEDHYTCTNIDEMERIAREVPLSKIMRPEWDIATLDNLGVSKIHVDYNAWERVWSKEEKINYASTPMFLVYAEK